tara:strand:+ start:3755 stop:5053 length:1299 start_codon:yes stop_codon:yes gene_type:complete
MARRPFFSGNYGSALGSYDTAARLLAGAGQAQGQMFANLGADIGGAIEKYQLNKEKRDKSEAAAMGKIAYIMQNEPDTLFDVANNSPKFGKALRQVSENPGEATYKDFDTINATLASWDQTRTAGIERDQNMERQGWARQLADERQRGADARTAILQSDADLKALLVEFKQETQDPRINDMLNILNERQAAHAFKDKIRPLREQTDTNLLRAQAMASKKAPLIASGESDLKLQQVQAAQSQQPHQADVTRGQLVAAKRRQDIQSRAFEQRGGTPRAVEDMIRDAAFADRQKQIAGEAAELKLEHQREFGAPTMAAQLEGILSATAARNLSALASAAPSDPTAAQRLTQINALTSSKVIQLDPRWHQAAADVLHGGDIDAQPLLVNFMDYQKLVASDPTGRKFAMTGKAEEIKKEIDRLSAPSWSPQQRVRVR